MMHYSIDYTIVLSYVDTGTRSERLGQGVNHKDHRRKS